MEEQLKFGSRVINYKLLFKERKTLGIKVHPDCQVEVLSPVKAKRAEIIERLRKKAPWILKQIDKFNAYKPGSRKRRFVNGETHLYLGRQYRLKIISDVENAVKAYRGQLRIHAINIKIPALKLQLEQWFKERAAVVFNELFEEVWPKFNRYKLKKPSISIRKMNKRWGSCTADGKILLNSELIKAPKGCIEYVIAHEICHLVHHSHDKAYYNILRRIVPDWSKQKNRLESILANQ